MPDLQPALSAAHPFSLAKPDPAITCQHCNKPLREHTWRAECIGAFWLGGSDVEPRGTFWQPRSQEAVARSHFAVPVQAFDEEGRAVPFFTPSLSELIGDPEFDFLAARAPDDVDRPVSRVERALQRMHGDAPQPSSFETKGVLCLLGLAIPVVVVLLLNTIGGR